MWIGRRSTTIATLTAGDKLTLKVENGVVRIIGPGDVAVGQLEPKIGQRVMRLVEAGNRYSAAITSIDEHHVRIIIREEFRDPSMRSRPSFPTHRRRRSVRTPRTTCSGPTWTTRTTTSMDEVDVDARRSTSPRATRDASKDSDDDDDDDDDDRTQSQERGRLKSRL